MQLIFDKVALVLTEPFKTTLISWGFKKKKNLKGLKSVLLLSIETHPNSPWP